MTKPLKVLDCFSGIGGFALAESFFEGQFETKQFVEINPYCQQVLSKNFKGVPIHEDIKTFTAPRGSFDICNLRFPCQDISIGGQQKGIGEGTRSGLFYECIRLLREIRPQFAIFENVRNLLSIEEGGYSKKSSFKLPKQGMMLNGQLFQQEMWVAVTLENVCGSLPTPNTMDHLPPRGYDSMIKQTQVHRKGRTKLANLREAVNPKAVKLFNELQQLRLPTPTSRDWKDSGENMNYKKAAEKKRLAGVLNHTHSDLTGEDMTLNPAFLEEMMGFPAGWTQIGETEKKE